MHVRLLASRYSGMRMQHKSLKSNEIYINIKQTMEKANHEFTVKIAEKPEDIKALLEVGFEYVCQKDNLISMGKRK